jgi:hypothetical protein
VAPGSVVPEQQVERPVLLLPGVYHLIVREWHFRKEYSIDVYRSKFE